MHNEKHTHVKRTIADMIFLILGCAIGAFSTTAVMIQWLDLRRTDGYRQNRAKLHQH